MPAGSTLSVVGDVYTFRATGQETGGAYTLWEARVPPGGGPPPHIHHREDEAFYVLEGEITFYTRGQEVRGGAGFFVHLPRGEAHHFHNHGTAEARTLIMTFPAGIESFFAEIGSPLPGPEAAPAPVTQEDIQKLLEAAPRYGIEILAGPH